MTAMNPTATRTTTVNWKLLVLMLAGALAGAVAGMELMHLVKSTGLSVKSLSWPDLVALTLGVSFVAIAVVTALVATNRKQLAKALEIRATGC